MHPVVSEVVCVGELGAEAVGQAYALLVLAFVVVVPDRSDPSVWEFEDVEMVIVPSHGALDGAMEIVVCGIHRHGDGSGYGGIAPGYRDFELVGEHGCRMRLNGCMDECTSIRCESETVTNRAIIVHKG